MDLRDAYGRMLMAGDYLVAYNERRSRVLNMINRFIGILLCWFLLGTVVYAEQTLEATNEAVIVDSLTVENDDEVAKAVEAMTIEAGDEVEDEVSEAAEVDKVVKCVEAEESEGKLEKVDPWEAFEPPVDSEFDWLQLTSGEWLKGDFKVMFDYTLEFDSDELDLLEFDFEDVKQLRTRAMKTVLVKGEDNHNDMTTLRGILFLKGDQVVLRRSEYEVSIPRDRVISIAGGQQREKLYWSGMASIGLNTRGGNTETEDITFQANLKRQTVQSRSNIDYLSNYSSTDNDETANNQRLNGHHDRFLTARFYWRALDAEYYRDPFSNIAGQYSGGTGIGYDIIHTSRTEWSIGTGVGYQQMRFDSVQPGEDRTSSSPFLSAGTSIDYDLTGDIDLIYDYSMRWLNDDNGRYTHHMVATISFDVTGDLDLDVSGIWDRIEEPQLDSDDELPEKDDYQLIVSLAYDF